MTYIEDNPIIKSYFNGSRRPNNIFWSLTVSLGGFGFFLAVAGAIILGNADIYSQWLGWTICTLSCLIWIAMGIKDRDVPRTLMEVMYFFIGIRAIINWLYYNS